MKQCTCNQVIFFLPIYKTRKTDLKTAISVSLSTTVYLIQVLVEFKIDLRKHEVLESLNNLIVNDVKNLIDILPCNGETCTLG